MAFTTSPRPAVQLANLTPAEQLRAGRLGRRLPQLLVGLVLYGVSMAMMVRSGLGLMPWDVLHYGVATWLPLTFGGVVIATGVAVLLLWIPLRQMPGLGTVANALVIGIAADATLGSARDLRRPRGEDGACSPAASCSTVSPRPSTSAPSWGRVRATG